MLIFLAAELGLGEFDQLGRAVADDRAVRGEPRGEVVDIGLAHGRFGAEHADRPGSSTFSAAGLIAGTVPTTGRSSAGRT